MMNNKFSDTCSIWFANMRVLSKAAVLVNSFKEQDLLMINETRTRITSLTI